MGVPRSKRHSGASVGRSDSRNLGGAWGSVRESPRCALGRLDLAVVHHQRALAALGQALVVRDEHQGELASGLLLEKQLEHALAGGAVQ